MAEPKQQFEPDDFRMTFFEHLEELRTRLIHALIGIAIGVLILVPIGKDLVSFLCVPLFRALRDAGLEPRVIVLGAPAAFTIYVKVVIIGGLIAASPWVVFQVWKFISTGLYAHERKVVYIIMPLSATMTTLGLFFMYFVMLPVALTFLVKFAVGYGPPGGTEPGFLGALSNISGQFAGANEEEKQPIIIDEPGTPLAEMPVFEVDPEKDGLNDGDMWFNITENVIRIYVGGRTYSVTMTRQSMLDPQLELGQYIGFVTLMTLGIVIGFQMPVILLIGGWTQIVDPRWLAKYRKYCVFLCFVFGAVLTPADPISMLVLAFPLWMLFELGLVLGRLVYRGPEHKAEGAE